MPDAKIRLQKEIAMGNKKAEKEANTNHAKMDKKNMKKGGVMKCSECGKAKCACKTSK